MMTWLPVDGALFLIKTGRRITPQTLAILSGSGLGCGCDSALSFFLLITHWGLRGKNREKGMQFRAAWHHLLSLVYAIPQHELLLLRVIMPFSIWCLMLDQNKTLQNNCHLHKLIEVFSLVIMKYIFCHVSALGTAMHSKCCFRGKMGHNSLAI